MTLISVAAIQMAFSDDRAQNIQGVEEWVLKAAEKGAQVILPSELFEGPYFCKNEREEYFEWAHPVERHPTIARFQKLAAQLKVVLPISFFEREGPHYYNSIAVIDADGNMLGVYRKSHIPDGPGYEEKFYFRPGNTGFKVWNTRYAKIGIGICWDQWFPEAARAMALLGAELLLYPTAIGSEPEAPEFDTKNLWQRAMQGHAVSNVIPVMAANRIGTEGTQSFYGHSFISNHRGDLVAELGRNEKGLVQASFDLAEIRRHRASFGFFRDRRPELYGSLTAI